MSESQRKGQLIHNFTDTDERNLLALVSMQDVYNVYKCPNVSSMGLSLSPC